MENAMPEQPAKGVEVLDLEWLRNLKRATITQAEAAKLYGVNPRTLTAAIKDGTIPAIRMGHRVVIPREPLLTMLSGATLPQESA